jgi:hypothetical protein
MADGLDVGGLPFRNFAELERIAPVFSQELLGANRQAHTHAAAYKGSIARGQVHLDEFAPAYLKSHQIQPNQEIVRKTPQGELHIHFDSAGLPAGADLNAKGGSHEHVTTNSQGKILADDNFDGHATTSHIGFDDKHNLTELNIESEQFDKQKHDLGPIHLAYKWDAQRRLVYAHSDYPNGIEDLHNEPKSKTIVTSNPNEGTDKDEYVYDLKTNKLDYLDFTDLKGKEFIIKRAPDGSLDIQGPLSRI